MTFSWVLFDADGVLQHLRDGWLEDLTALTSEDFVLEFFRADGLAMTGERDFAVSAKQLCDEFGIQADLQDVLGAVQLRQTHDPPDGVRIDHEVLSPLLGGVDAQARRKVTDMGRREQGRERGGVLTGGRRACGALAVGVGGGVHRATHRVLRAANVQLP